MFKYFILRDRRLKGNLPAIPEVMITFALDASVPIANALTRVNTAAQLHGKLKTLFILCHGFGEGWGTTSDFWWRGGKGLQLGTENLQSNNVNLWQQIRNQVENIVVYACGAAYTGMSSITNNRSKSDGQQLMTTLAMNTGANVYAADKIQWYFPKNYDFGRWEGTVYWFMPSGLKVANFLPPTEVTEVVTPK